LWTTHGEHQSTSRSRDGRGGQVRGGVKAIRPLVGRARLAASMKARSIDVTRRCETALVFDAAVIDTTRHSVGSLGGANRVARRMPCPAAAN